MKLLLVDGEVKVDTSGVENFDESNVWLTFNPIIPTLRTNEIIKTHGLSRADAFNLLKGMHVHSDFEPGYDETIFKTVFPDVNLRPTYDRHLMKQGDFMLHIYGKGELGEYTYELLYITTESEE